MYIYTYIIPCVLICVSLLFRLFTLFSLYVLLFWSVLNLFCLGDLLSYCICFNVFINIQTSKKACLNGYQPTYSQTLTYINSVHLCSLCCHYSNLSVACMYVVFLAFAVVVNLLCLVCYFAHGIRICISVVVSNLLFPHSI